MFAFSSLIACNVFSWYLSSISTFIQKRVPFKFYNWKSNFFCFRLYFFNCINAFSITQFLSQCMHSGLENEINILEKIVFTPFQKVLKHVDFTFFRNKRFALNEMFQRYASKFAIFYAKENVCIFFCFSFLSQIEKWKKTTQCS